MNIGILILRLVLGGIFIGHGSQKLFGWFGGRGMTGTIAMIERMGARPVLWWAILAALSEFGGGVLVLLGLLNPLGSLGIMAAMLIAIFQVHWSKGFWNSKGGIEFPLINLASALAIALVGPGSYSLDAVLRISLPEPASLLTGLALVLLGGIAEQASHTRHEIQPRDANQRR